MISELKELEEAINSRTEDNESLQHMSNRLYNNWEEMRKRWSTIVLHEELDVIALSLISMKTNIRTGEYNRALEQIDKSIFLLEDIVEKERVTIRNIL